MEVDPVYLEVEVNPVYLEVEVDTIQVQVQVEEICLSPESIYVEVQVEGMLVQIPRRTNLRKTNSQIYSSNRTTVWRRVGLMTAIGTRQK